MGSRLHTWLLPLAATIAVAAVVAHDRNRAARLSVELGYALREHRELIGLQAENRRLESGQPTAADFKTLQDQHAQAEALRRRLDELHRKKADAGNQESAPLAAKDWAYLGHATPKATIESVLWAASRGDVDRLADLMGFAPGVRAAADTMFSRLPATSQHEYGTAEKVVATLLAGSFPKEAEAARVLADQQFGGDDAAITMAVTHSDGQSRINLFQFHKTTDGWRLLIPAAILNDYEHTLLGDQQADEIGTP